MTKPKNHAGTQSARHQLEPRCQPYLWLCMHIGRPTMAKKSHVSSQPAGLKSMKSEDIKKRRWTKAELESIRRIAARQAESDDSHISFADIPRLTDQQLASMVRLRDARPRKVAVSVRLTQKSSIG